ncbi:hypothetical protein MBLNU457_7387t1 [Dothideomycetes sp. NU457]
MSPSNLPSHMQAWQKPAVETAPEPVRNSVPVPSPGEHEILLKILAAGVCHSDSYLLETPRTLQVHKEPFTLGHEGCGEIVSLGSNVDETKISIGQRVSVVLAPGCKQKGCTECNRGLERLCKRMGIYGFQQPGFFAPYVVVKDWAVVPVPEAVSSPVAAVAPDAVLTAYHAVKTQAKVGPGMTIIIYGLGGLGLNAVQIAMHLGVKRILVVDRRKTAVDQAIKLGVADSDAFCTEEGQKVEEYVSTNGIYVDATIDFVSSGETFLSAQQAVCIGGSVVMVGLIGQIPTYHPMLGVTKALKVLGSYSGISEELEEVLELLAQGKINPMVSTRSMDELPQVMDDMNHGRFQGRVVLLP